MGDNKIIKYDNRQLLKVGNAIAITNKLLTLRENINEYFYLDKGNLKADLNDFVGAIEDYTNAIRINPQLAIAFNNRGTAKGNLNDHFGAIEDYTKAIEINPQFGTSYSSRGSSKFNINNFLEAIEDFTKAIEINIIDSASYCGRGASKHMISDYFGAIEDYTKAIEIERQIEGIRDELPEAFFGRSKAKAKIGDFEGSKKDNMISNLYKLRVKI